MRARRSKVRRVAKWAGLMACVLLIAIYVASAWWYVTAWSAGRRYLSVCVGMGAVEVGFSHDQRVEPAMGAWGFSRHRVPMIWTPAVTRGPRPRAPMLTVTVRIPLWMLFAAVALPTAFLWYRDRRLRPGHCAHCGYNLHGLTEPRCPECGTGFHAGDETCP